MDDTAPSDRAAYEAVVEAEGGRLFAIAFAILSNPGGAKDAVQETVAAAWRGWAQRREPAKTGAWLTTICVRHARRRRGWLLRWPLGESSRARRPPTPSVVPGVRRTRPQGPPPRLWKALHQQRAVVALHSRTGIPSPSAPR